ncbi:Tat pathway signal sequence domain protein [Streptomyces ipomoeae]|uniref:LamG-like jellyroll fold domain-containing protein n=2 Tax=Streptomyces ipomoeae TaxID=103232 RepID=UPI0029AB38D2|nr:LamG-like jellyroll fold domain-containing protein [Streptomyces ipomoeae]MDX2695206.1 Tat pathway signal sequence domain protein [Streptomyces ipomoeae]MDX2822873.1 Tat pathway signal sequence domain protein [Streptomyces ipomoeae]MDX2841194.1 Tat pathway signal sequence domain protein [Streptomyces ipomoeae]MDX2876223.1 Tat pathway signal sequence domain protein [Streptomyces ipomoeae]
MCTSHEHDQGEAAQADAGRRQFLRATALMGAAATAAAALPAATARAAGAESTASAARWRPDPDSRRFTLAVMPDTQYLFDGPSIDKAPVEASLRHLLEHGREENIVFLSHLGDLTQNGAKEECAAIGEAFRLLDRRGVGYSVLAGNHDVRSSTDDQRGSSPYLDVFGPDRFKGKSTYGGASPDGYNTFHLFEAGGRQWMVLALDWRLSAKGFAWAEQVMAEHPRTPVILTTHELVDEDDSLSTYGRKLWDQLIADHDQIFLTLNGHYWPAARATRENAAGNEVHLHLTNYQNRYFGGAAMIRLYRFDLDRNTIDVETISPWIMGRAAKGLGELERQEIELSGDADRFSVDIDFDKRFAGFAPVPARPARPVSKMLVPGTVAYWRFDGRQDGAAVSGTIEDRSGHGNDLTLVTVGGGTLAWSADHHPDQPGHGSLEFHGGKPPLKGAYLRTVDGAPLNSATFEDGYTIEAFYRLPADWNPSNHAWAGILGRTGTGGAAGRTQDDPDEPLATLSLSNDREPQWAVRPLNQQGIATNWGQETPLETWWHLAVVNDGEHTTMYVQGCPVVRNPRATAIGLTSVGLPWLLGGYEYGGRIDQILHGRLGDVRIVERALPVKSFMNH